MDRGRFVRLEDSPFLFFRGKNMTEKLPLCEAAKREMEAYQFLAEPEPGGNSFKNAASSVVDAGACGVHVAFPWMLREAQSRIPAVK